MKTLHFRPRRPIERSVLLETHSLCIVSASHVVVAHLLPLPLPLQHYLHNNNEGPSLAHRPGAPSLGQRRQEVRRTRRGKKINSE